MRSRPPSLPLCWRCPCLAFAWPIPRQGLTLDYRFRWVAYAAAAVFVGRLALSLLLAAFGHRLRVKEKGRVANFVAHTDRNQKYAGWAIIAIALVLPLPALRRPQSGRPRHAHSHLCHAGHRAEHYGWASPACSISVTSPSMRWVLIPMRCSRNSSGFRSGFACRSRGCWRQARACSSAFRCCACAAIIWPSSRWASARSCASCCSIGKA